MSFDSLHDLYVDELKDLYSAENQILKALPRMAKKATAPELKEAFTEHLEVTRKQRTEIRSCPISATCCFRGDGPSPGNRPAERSQDGRPTGERTGPGRPWARPPAFRRNLRGSRAARSKPGR